MFVHGRAAEFGEIQFVAGPHHRVGEHRRLVDGHAPEDYRHQQRGRLVVWPASVGDAGDERGDGVGGERVAVPLLADEVNGTHAGASIVGFPMTDTARVLLTAAVLSAGSMGFLAWQLIRTDPQQPARLIGELRLAQFAAMILAATGGLPMGLAIAAAPGVQLAHLDLALGVIVVVVAGLVLLRDPRQGLLVAASAFLAHALIDLAHSPGLLSPALAPRWFFVGCAVYDVVLAAVCYWGRRR